MPEELNNLNGLQKAYYLIRKQQEEILRLKNQPTSNPIAVVGLACRFPGGAKNEQEFWRVLEQGEDAIKEVPSDRWNKSKFYDEDVLAVGKTNSKWGGFVDDFSHFDPDFFNISRAELLEMDPQQRLLLLTSYEALENSGFLKPEQTEKNGGVFVGIGGMDHGFYLNSFANPEEVGPYLGSGNAYSVASGRLSNWFGWTGPSVSYDTACSSSLVSVHYACMHLAQKDCNVALAGGVNVLLSEQVQISLSKAGMLASDGRCKTFDQKANGYVRGEGCGMLVLKRLEDAIEDGDNIRAVISGSAIAQDGDSGGLTVPSRSSQELVIRKAIEKAGIQPKDLQYIEAHGTGTSLGDPIEIDALSQVLSENNELEHKIPVGSVKTNIGHLEAGAGIAGIIKVILALENDLIPRHLNCDEPSSFINWEQIALEVCRNPRKWNANKTRYAGVSSFGFAGTIGHMILKEAPKTEQRCEIQQDKFDLVISAKTESGLENFIESYGTYLETTEEEWSDICYTAGLFRPRYACQKVIQAANKKEAIQELQKETINTKATFNFPEKGKKVILPNYPFQSASYLKRKEINEWLDIIYKTEWVSDATYKGSFEKGNYLVLTHSDVQNESHPLLKVMKDEGAIVKKMRLDDFLAAKEINLFDDSFDIIYWVDAKDGQYSTVLKTVWSSISMLQKLAASSDQKVQSFYALGSDRALMQAVNGVLKTAALELNTISPKCFVLDVNSESEIMSSLSYFNQDHEHKTMRFVNGPEYVQIAPQNTISKNSTLSLLDEKLYIISGGMGSLGRALADYLIEKGAQRIWLLSRGSFENETRPERIDWYQTARSGIEELKIVQCDCANEADMDQLDQRIKEEKLSVGGIFHVAGMNNQQPFTEIKEEDCDFVMKAKVKGAILLDTLSRNWNPDHFVLFSSISATWGSSHLAHYAAANAFLNGLTEKRKSEGFNSLCIDWSAWEGSYMLNMNEEGLNVLKDSGISFLKPTESLEILGSLMTTEETQVVVCQNDWEKFIPLLEINGQNSFWNALRKEPKTEKQTETSEFVLVGNTQVEKRGFLKKAIKKEMKILLQYNESDTIDESRPFSELGMDSIMAVRFVKRLNQLLNLDLSTNIVFNYPNITDITEYILEILLENEQDEIINIEEELDDLELDEVTSGANEEDWLSKIDEHLDRYDV